MTSRGILLNDERRLITYRGPATRSSLKPCRGDQTPPDSGTDAARENARGGSDVRLGEL